MPGLTIGDTIPDLEVETTQGKIKIHDYVGSGYAILFSHPGDFTPVCTTELGMMAKYAPEFEKRGVKLLGLSCDDVETHKKWTKDIEAYASDGCKVNYPIVADPKRELIKKLNMVDPDERDDQGQLPSRALHIVGPDKKVKLSFLYPATTGRNMDEVLRVVDSLQLATKAKVATPVNWKVGDKVVIPASVGTDEAKKKFPDGFETVDLPSKKDYLRFANV